MGKKTEGLSKKEIRRRKKKKSLIIKTVVLIALLAVLGVCVFFLIRTMQAEQKEQQPAIQEEVTPSPEPEIETKLQCWKRQLIWQRLMIMMGLSKS